jgi:hypothetical protein
MAQQGQVFPLAGQGADGTRWAYRYRVGGRGSKRVQRGGFASEQAAPEALERKLEQLRREPGLLETPTLAEFVEVYLAQHEGDPETKAKLRWLLQKAVCVFGEQRLSELRSPAVAAWRITIPRGTVSRRRRRSARFSRGRLAGDCWTSTRPSLASRTRSAVTGRSGLSSPGKSWTRSPAGSARATVRWSCSRRRPA